MSRWFGLLALASMSCASTERHVAPSLVHLESSPEGAYVAMTDTTGSRTVGQAPVDVEVSYFTETMETAPGLWLTPAISGVLTAVGVVLAANSDLSSGDGAGALGLVTASLAGTTFLISLPVALILAGMDGEIVSQGYEAGPPSFEASLPGFSRATSVLSATEPPPTTPIKLGLHPMNALAGGLGAAGADTSGRVSSDRGGLGLIGSASVLGTQTDATRPVIAVFEIHDPTLPRGLVMELTQYLGARLAEHGRFRVVPDSALRERLAEDKSKSYSPCVDDRCQIEVGKAVAASKSLSTRVLRVGSTCTLSSTLFDLKTEAAETAASVRSSCTQEGLLEALDQVAARLSGH